MRHDEREEGPEGGAHEPIENGLREGAPTGAGDRAAAGVAEQSVAGGHSSVNYGHGGALCLITAPAAAAPAIVIVPLVRACSSAEQIAHVAAAKARSHAAQPTDATAVLVVGTVVAPRQQPPAAATAAGGGPATASGRRSDGGRDGVRQVPRRPAGRARQPGQSVAVDEQPGAAGIPAAVVPRPAGHGGQRQYPAANDAVHAHPILLSILDGAGGSTGGR